MTENRDADLGPIRGRGASTNPRNRFETIEYVHDPEDGVPPDAPRTLFLRDPSRSIIATNDSPDIGFNASINVYRGCEHGCSYCFARPTHEYLGFSAGLDFESRIIVKEDAPELLRKALSSRSWKPQIIGMSGVTDPYQPIEKKLQLTRRCLEVLADFRNPVAVITKNHLVTRDIDILKRLAEHDAVSVSLSITTLDDGLSRIMEPRASRPALRLDAVRKLSDAGIPVSVMVAPVVPAITDHQMPEILARAAEAGAISAGYITLRLPWAVAPLFERWLEEHFPDRMEKVLNRIRSLRNGKLYDPRFGIRKKGEGIFAEQFRAIFEVARRKAGLDGPVPALSTASFVRHDLHQKSLFDD